MKSYYIQLIRNGLTAGNVGGKYIGHTDEELSAEGIEQIKQMKTDFHHQTPFSAQICLTQTQKKKSSET